MFLMGFQMHVYFLGFKILCWIEYLLNMSQYCPLSRLLFQYGIGVRVLHNLQICLRLAFIEILVSLREILRRCKMCVGVSFFFTHPNVVTSSLIQHWFNIIKSRFSLTTHYNHNYAFNVSLSSSKRWISSIKRLDILHWKSSSQFQNHSITLPHDNG